MLTPKRLAAALRDSPPKTTASTTRLRRSSESAIPAASFPRRQPKSELKRFGNPPVDSVRSDTALRMTEGWPLSIVEAASFLWRRGVLIAIVSKNDERTALTLWEKLYGSRFSMKNFVATRINWKPKAENIQEILQAANL